MVTRKKTQTGAATTMRTAELFKPSPPPRPHGIFLAYSSPAPNESPGFKAGGRARKGRRERASPAKTPPAGSKRMKSARRPGRTGTPKITRCCGTAGRPRKAGRPKREAVRPDLGFVRSVRCHGIQRTVMILPQVHLRKPCYDFYFL